MQYRKAVKIFYVYSTMGVFTRNLSSMTRNDFEELVVSSCSKV